MTVTIDTNTEIKDEIQTRMDIFYNEFSKDVMNSSNYDEALSKITNWVNVE
jgi:hypothetical protein